MCVDTPNAVDKNALLSVAKVCRAIANKVCPPYDAHIKGFDCIVGKFVELPFVPAKPSRSFQHIVSQPLNASEPALDQQTPFGLQFDLSQEDREWMIKNVSNLSNLQFPYLNNDDKAFLDAFERLEHAPNWRPVLLSWSDVDRRKRDHDEVCDSHFKKFRALVKQSKLRAVTKEHLPVENLTLADFVIAQDVADYCRQCGIEIEIEGVLTITALADLAPRESSQTIDEPSTKDVLKSFREKLSKSQYRQALEVLNTFNYIRGTRPLGLEVRKKIAEFHAVLDSENVFAPTLITTKVFKVSDKTVKDLRAEFRPRINSRLGRAST